MFGDVRLTGPGGYGERQRMQEILLNAQLYMRPQRAVLRATSAVEASIVLIACPRDRVGDVQIH